MKRLGIPNVQRLRLLPDSVEGIPDVLRKTPEGLLSDDKLRANMKYIARMRSEMAKTKGARAGRWVAYDLWTAPCAGIVSGAKYMICLIDVSSGTIRIYPMTDKGQVPTMLERFLRDTRKYFDTKMLFADNAKEHKSKAVDEICNKHKIEHRFSCEYEPCGDEDIVRRQVFAIITKARLQELLLPNHDEDRTFAATRAHSYRLRLQLSIN